MTGTFVELPQIFFNLSPLPPRRVAEAPNSPPGGISDSQTEVLEQICRKANIKMAKEMVDTQQQEYIMAEQKARAQEETVRKVHQKEANHAMDVCARGGKGGGRREKGEENRREGEERRRGEGRREGEERKEGDQGEEREEERKERAEELKGRKGEGGNRGRTQ